MSFRKINFPAWKNDPSLRFILAALVIFLVAVTIRFLHFQDFHIKARTVQTVVVENYFRSAEALLQLGPEVLLDPNSEAGNMDSMGHPPGFPIVCAVLAKLFGSSDAAIQAFLFLADACSALLVFLIATRLYGTGTGFCAGTMIALSPQFA